jgi:hypothetical protein
MPFIPLQTGVSLEQLSKLATLHSELIPPTAKLLLSNLPDGTVHNVRTVPRLGIQ